MDIRPLKEEDDFKELIRDSIPSIDNSSYNVEDLQHLREVIPEMNEEFFQEDRFSYFVAVEDEEIIGLAGFNTKSGTLSGIFVKPERKGSGIGSKLLEKIEKVAKENGIGSLEVPSSLDAVEFYRKNGYKELGKEDRDVKERKITMLIMAKEL